MIDFKKELNAAQYEVVTKADGPSLVLAGAGSGKTRTLVYRVAYLLEQGIAPERILLLTFTNKAAHEMLSRVETLVGKMDQKTKPRTERAGASSGTGVYGGTFHHVANRLLRKLGSAIGLKSNFTILDREDSKDMLKRIIKEVAGPASPRPNGVSGRRMPQPGIFLEVIGYAANAQLKIAEAMERKYSEGMQLLPLFEKVAARYAEKKQTTHSLDFDDLLTVWLRLLKVPSVKEKLQGFWEYILVDEYQDTNIVQDEIVRTLAAKHQNVLVVGDDAQSIYSFRAADIENILQFPKQFPDAKVFKLEENYRSSPEILSVANEVIAHNTAQFKKTLFTATDPFIKPELMVMQDPSEEAEQVAERIMALEDEGVPLDRIAVLFRAAHQSQALELELNKRSIPYEMRGGLRFFERAHIKDALAYTRLIANLNDESSWYRVLATYEGIGEVTAQKIILVASELADWIQLPELSVSLSQAAGKGWGDFVTTIGAAYAQLKAGPGAIIRSIMPYYRRYAESQYQDFKDRMDDIEQLALFADRYETLGEFIADTSLQEAYAVRGGREEGHEASVVLSTIHQAKGLEWNTVFIISLTNASLPHPRAAMEEGGLEEERRLFYVAITRAQRRLYLVYPLSSSRFNMSLHQPSQFLREIGNGLITGKLDTDGDEGYINVDPVTGDITSNGVDEDGERSFLPSIDDL